MAKIRLSRPSEGQRVLAIWRASVDATHDFLTPEDRTAIDAEVAAFLSGATLWIAAAQDDRALGFMLLSEGHMDALFVDPAAHGLGIGRVLVGHALMLHPDLTADVNEQNEQAIGFYRAMGFEPTGRSELDGQGRPYPLIHLRYSAAA